ncbi:Uncharacterized protein B5E39_2392 [Bacillus cereus]|nr:Uncharacterized protein B5E39_2392 [Bacillus cereus]
MKKHSTTILWIIPLLFFIHNLEEAFQMPQYLANQFSIRLITSQQFFIAISVLTIFVLLIVFLYQLNFLSSICWIIFIQGAIFFNSVQHIILFFIYRSYNPGVISAFFITLFSIFFFYQKTLNSSKAIRNYNPFQLIFLSHYNLDHLTVR